MENSSYRYYIDDIEYFSGEKWLKLRKIWEISWISDVKKWVVEKILNLELHEISFTHFRPLVLCAWCTNAICYFWAFLTSSFFRIFRCFWMISILNIGVLFCIKKEEVLFFINIICEFCCLWNFYNLNKIYHTYTYSKINK